MADFLDVEFMIGDARGRLKTGAQPTAQDYFPSTDSGFHRSLIDLCNLNKWKFDCYRLDVAA